MSLPEIPWEVPEEGRLVAVAPPGESKMSRLMREAFLNMELDRELAEDIARVIWRRTSAWNPGLRARWPDGRVVTPKGSEIRAEVCALLERNIWIWDLLSRSGEAGAIGQGDGCRSGGKCLRCCLCRAMQEGEEAERVEGGEGGGVSIDM